jgi:hypothetical protein
MILTKMLKYEDHNYMHVGRYIKSIKVHLRSFKHDLDFLTKSEYINLLILADQWNPQMQILSPSIMKSIYFIMLENLSMFFYRCTDNIYVLERLKVMSSEKDFWIRVEDVVMRVKNDYTIE